MSIVSRFAPAPTGYLHLGHVLNAAYVWGVTRVRGGRVLLRIEDHDRQRSRPEYEAAIVTDLDWLGFTPDFPAVRQSDRGTVYEAALARLRARDLVYVCECSRTEIAGTTGGEESDELRYRGTCAQKGLNDRPGSGLRVRLDYSNERFNDLRHGPQAQIPSEQCGDLLLRDRDGNWTYQFAVTVDDFDQSVTLIIRGDDLLASTGRQLQLARLLGRTEPPSFLHHPLLMRSPTQKLSKAAQDTGVHELRAEGFGPSQVIGRALALAGLVEDARPVGVRELPELFQAFG